jgi:hypothetical protein
MKQMQASDACSWLAVRVVVTSLAGRRRRPSSLKGWRENVSKGAAAMEGQLGQGRSCVHLLPKRSRRLCR